MRRLWLMRHASAGEATSDHERPLRPGGRLALRGLGDALRGLPDWGRGPEQVLCSSALRARQTYEELHASGALERDAELEPGLYLASAKDLLRRLQELEADCRSALVIGHNPGLGELLRALVASGEPRALARARPGFPAGGLAGLELSATSWRALEPGGAHLLHFLCPGDPVG